MLPQTKAIHCQPLILQYSLPSINAQQVTGVKRVRLHGNKTHALLAPTTKIKVLRQGVSVSRLHLVTISLYKVNQRFHQRISVMLAITACSALILPCQLELL